MKFGINQAISQTITQLSCIQLETPSSRLWNFWWIKTYTTFKRGAKVSDIRGLYGRQVLLQFTTHYNDVIMGAMSSQITILTIVYSTVYSGADQRKHQSSASLAFMLGIHQWLVISPHKWPVTRKMFPFDDVIMMYKQYSQATVRVHL